VIHSHGDASKPERQRDTRRTRRHRPERRGATERRLPRPSAPGRLSAAVLLVCARPPAPPPCPSALGRRRRRLPARPRPRLPPQRIRAKPPLRPRQAASAAPTHPCQARNFTGSPMKLTSAGLSATGSGSSECPFCHVLLVWIQSK
jgi:hypothetical protein